jgi:hypothetical protein
MAIRDHINLTTLILSKPNLKQYSKLIYGKLQ